ncbi:MAG: exodeoxyribonuclease V subunit gamma [Solirubrobacterales bacterium]|nr:exodeoxyribonuclease V subunit gamma [Solirubrobacterales bacterium]
MLHVHRSERADRLADGLAGLLAVPLADPLASEIVAVPTRGIERWLTQRLSSRLGASPRRGDGVCANVEFPFPSRVVQAALAGTGGVDPDTDPWSAERLVWPLLELVDECLDEPWLARLAAHLQGAGREGDEHQRRFAVVRHIADLFDRYGVHRPEMLRAWAAGENGEASWQAELWRRLRWRIDTPSPAERLARACERLRVEPELLDLPARLSLFGLTRIPRSYLDVLAAVAGARNVHLFVLHPSPALWAQVRGRMPELVIERRHDPTATLAHNRLLASWGRDARELQLVIAGSGEAAEHHHELRAGASRLLLERIQDAIRRDQQPPGLPMPDQPDERATLADDDRSVQIHSCHGRARQVEVLRDAVLHLLADDPTLEPRDVIVMCPDIETFAPLIQATFGTGTAAGGIEDGERDADDRRMPDLRVRLADRSLRQTNPVLGVVSRMLELADQRATASQLLDLADREAVRRRFGFDDDELTRMQEWVRSSGIRWGFNTEHRRPFKLESVSAGTWQDGLERLMLGVAMSEEDRRLVGHVLPLDDVESGVIDLAGRFAEYVERVREAVGALTGPHSLRDWVRAIGAAADALAATRERDAWQRSELERLLDEVTLEASDSDVALGLADVRALLADRLRGRPTRANFRTGHLTVCTLVPMRSVPHRVICVLGLDDGEFPRRALRDGDDLMLERPHVGDRDPRSEDRQMLLDALLAAGERMIVTYTGNDERTNLPRPPAVPVGELLETVDQIVRSDAGPAREQVLVRHPLQPFDPRNFAAGALHSTHPWSFDRSALAGAQALIGERRDPPPFLASPLPVGDGRLIELERLVAFAENPVRAFLRGRLGIAVGEYGDELEDALPVELDPLGRWAVGQRLLEGLLGGAELDDCLRAERARGSLPPGELATPVLGGIAPLARRIAELAREHSAGTPRSLDINLPLPDGRTLAGTVSGVCGGTLRSVSFSRVKAKDRLAAWVRLLALTAARPEVAHAAIVIGRARVGSRRGSRLTMARIGPLGRDAETRCARAWSELESLLDLFDRGMREPLPIAAEASAAYAGAAIDGEDAAAAADAVWTTSFRPPKEDRAAEQLTVHGAAIGLGQLLAAEPRIDEQGAEWAATEASRFGRYALRLWSGLLGCEQLSDQ